MNKETLGPIVTATASARISTPWSMRALTSEPNLTSFAYQRCTWLTCCAFLITNERTVLGKRYICKEISQSKIYIDLNDTNQF